MNKKEAKQLVGKSIEWLPQDSGLKRSGKVEHVSGQNLLIDGEWMWLSTMENIRVIPGEVNPATGCVDGYR